MKNVFLVDTYYNDCYISTCGLVFTSKAAAKKYAADCEFQTQIKEVPLLTLSDFKELPF